MHMVKDKLTIVKGMREWLLLMVLYRGLQGCPEYEICFSQVLLSLWKPKWNKVSAPLGLGVA
jgi:hypothetical protein